MDRRTLIRTAVVAVIALPGAMLVSGPGARAATPRSAVDVGAILDDPDSPVIGAPDGDVTIVAFIDYNCLFCKRSDPDLRRLVADDGRIKLIYKDWPILAQTSVYGARLALAAKYQGQYQSAHAALLALHGKRASEAGMTGAVKAAGVDMARLDADLKAHGAEIAALLARNEAQADALGLKGTPVFLIGPYLVEAALNYDGFSEVVSKFRARIAK